MARKIYLNGLELLYVEDLITKYGLTSTYMSRANIMDRIRHLGGKDFATREDYEYIEELAKHETSGYTINQTIAVTGLTDYTLSSHEAMFSEIFASNEFGGVIYYAKDEVDKLAEELRDMAFPVSEFCSRICGENVIYINELYHYANDKKVELLGRRKPAIKMARMLFPSDALVDIHGNLAVRSPGSIDDLLESCRKISLANILDNLLSPYNPNLINTVALMRRFYSARLNASESPRIYNIAISYANDLNRAYRNLRKEIYDYTEEELVSEVLGTDWCNNQIVMKFLQYVKTTAGNGFGDGMTFIYKNPTGPKENPDIYSYAEWGALYDYLTDISRHVGKAYEDRVYCQYWTAMLVHMTSLIRVSDIVSLRTLHLDGERFVRSGELLRHPLELGEAVTISDIFRIAMESLRTVKTDQLKHYYTVIEVAPAIATAVCILEYHRIRENDNRMFTVRAVPTDRIDEKFDGIPVHFQSTKATKTLATMLHAKAEENGVTNALYLVSAARSHRTHDGFSEVTSFYLQESMLEGDPREIAWYVCRRGVFGWLYIAMLEYIGGKIGSLEGATTQIEALKARLAPEQAEMIADFLHNAEREQRSLLKQLGQYSRKNIVSFLMNIGTDRAASGVSETYCIFGTACAKCRADQTTCLRCNASLKTNYTLGLINEKLGDLVARMHSIPDQNITERQKITYQIQQLLFVLMDAKDWFDKYDPRFLDAYVDLPQLQRDLMAIPGSKFLQIEEKPNG